MMVDALKALLLVGAVNSGAENSTSPRHLRAAELQSFLSLR